MNKECEEFLEKLKANNDSVVMLVAPESEDGTFRVFTVKDEMEWGRINDLIDGIDQVREILVNRRYEIDIADGNEPLKE